MRRSPAGLRLPLALRALLLTGLLALVVVGVPHEPETASPVWLGPDTTGSQLAALLTASTTPRAILREAGDAPTEAELHALAAAAVRAPLLVELPPADGRTTLRVTPPDVPFTDRYAAVRFTARTGSGDSLTARLIDPTGAVLDSTRVVTDSTGLAAGAFRIRPGRVGWHEWRVAISQAEGRVGAWVADAGAPRVLVVAGPPSWETRYAVRALEHSGADVSLVQHLGRDNVITSGRGSRTWDTEESLSGHDVVMLLPGAEPDPSSLAALADWAANGGGVLVAGGEEAALGLPGAEAVRTTAADSLAWTLPAEIAPLPTAELSAQTAVYPAPPPGSTVGARTADGEPVLLLASLGRGRTAAVGVTESWRWRMEAGLEAEHRSFWRSLVDWLALPSTDSLAVRVEPTEAGVGATVDVTFRGVQPRLRRPDGSAESLPEAGSHGRFVAADTGVHALEVDGSVVAAFRASPVDVDAALADAAELGRARLSLQAAASGGAPLEPEAFASRAEQLGVRGAQADWWLPWAFAGLVLLAAAEWAIRRRRGLR